MELKKIDDYRWEIPRTGAMRVPGLIYSSADMIDHVIREQAAGQVANVAQLPGIVDRSLAMPDVHWGYGFPIGGVAAFDAQDGVISPGGIGYDINCGVRLLRTKLTRADIGEKTDELVGALFRNVPSGVGSTGKLGLKSAEVARVLEHGAQWAVDHGYGTEHDLRHIEEEGRLDRADASCVSDRALERGREQLGTLGAGNHFLELQVVEEIFEPAVARAFGLVPGQVTVMIHTGSRGLGYQVCADYLRELQPAVARYHLTVPDRQLVCAPLGTPEADRYLAAMSCAANYAWANRQIITHGVRESLLQVLGSSSREIGCDVVYDVAHNIGKFETHRGRKLLVHRKGATRAFPAGHPALPGDYRAVGQPVIIPGTMGTASYVLVGTEQALRETWGSSCHGAGRMMSRTQALKMTRGQAVAQELAGAGITVRSESWRTLAEEAPFAYKDVSEVVEVCHAAGIAKKVVKLKPFGVVKG